MVKLALLQAGAQFLHKHHVQMTGQHPVGAISGPLHTVRTYFLLQEVQILHRLLKDVIGDHLLLSVNTILQLKNQGVLTKLLQVFHLQVLPAHLCFRQDSLPLPALLLLYGTACYSLSLQCLVLETKAAQ